MMLISSTWTRIELNSCDCVSLLCYILNKLDKVHRSETDELTIETNEFNINLSVPMNLPMEPNSTNLMKYVCRYRRTYRREVWQSDLCHDEFTCHLDTTCHR
jgi:hypothetical protein